MLLRNALLVNIAQVSTIQFTSSTVVTVKMEDVNLYKKTILYDKFSCQAIPMQTFHYTYCSFKQYSILCAFYCIQILVNARSPGPSTLSSGGFGATGTFLENICDVPCTESTTLNLR